jgi:cyclopropane fatty-acyl-phospholipid synthase-like methyltransferase
MSVAYLFRSYKEMPTMEQKLYSLPKILDVGCGAGSHSLYLQNELNLEVTAMTFRQMQYLFTSWNQRCACTGCHDIRK